MQTISLTSIEVSLFLSIFPFFPPPHPLTKALPATRTNWNIKNSPHYSELVLICYKTKQVSLLSEPLFLLPFCCLFRLAEKKFQKNRKGCCRTQYSFYINQEALLHNLSLMQCSSQGLAHMPRLSEVQFSRIPLFTVWLPSPHFPQLFSLITYFNSIPEYVTF